MEAVMAFVTMDVAYEMLRGLGPVIEQVEARDRDLASQMRRAGTSVVLNLAEGRERKGRDRGHHFRIASGSAAEVRAAVNIARMWSYACPRRSSHCTTG
jgi:four helix bundle protein